MELKKTISNSDSKQFQAGLNKKNSKKQKRKAKKLSSNVELTNNGLSPTTVHENVNECKEHIGDISSAGKIVFDKNYILISLYFLSSKALLASIDKCVVLKCFTLVLNR